MDLVKILKDEEGFSAKGYVDTENKITWGYGFTYITQEQAERCLKENIATFTEKTLAIIKNKELKLSLQAIEVLVLMCYQLGEANLLLFKNMWELLSKNDYVGASEEMLKSRWAIQTPARARRMAKLMSEANNDQKQMGMHQR